MIKKREHQNAQFTFQLAISALCLMKNLKKTSFIGRLLVVIMAALLVVPGLVSCTPSSGQKQVLTYNGMELPAPSPVQADNSTNQPPPAWLIVTNEAVPATYGSFCTTTGCVDIVAPQMIRGLARATLRPDTMTNIVIGSTSVNGVNVNVKEWTSEAIVDSTMVRTLTVEQKHEGDVTILTLMPINDVTDQLLEVAVTFEGGGDARYLWRINPSQ